MSSFIADILRKFDNMVEVILPQLPTSFSSISDPEGKGALIWILGEYGEVRRGGGEEEGKGRRRGGEEGRVERGEGRGESGEGRGKRSVGKREVTMESRRSNITQKLGHMFVYYFLFFPSFPLFTC